jgi:glutamate carboxypeptidase
VAHVDGPLQREAAEIAARAVRDLEALVAISSPSGDVEGAEACVRLVRELAPPGAAFERLPCSSPGHADDLLVRVRGNGAAGGARILLLGHLDTVVAHERHQPLKRDGARLVGSGAIDMKSGDVLALGVLRALAARPERFAEAALLLVMDEEWRRGPLVHVERFAGWDACLCFEAGELADDGSDAVIVKRKAAGTLRVEAHGVAAHAGAAPEMGRNALLALAAAAQQVAAAHDPTGPDRLTAVPTVLNSGRAFNVVPADGVLSCDLRSDRTDAFEELRAAIPAEIAGVGLSATLARAWPAMDARAATAPLIGRAAALLGRPLAANGRGGASDASHFAPTIPLTVDGLGPRGGRAHSPEEFLLEGSLLPRAEVALAVTYAALAAG